MSRDLPIGGYGSLNSDPPLREAEWFYRRHASRDTSHAIDPPINEYDALMRCGPNDIPEEPSAQRLAVRDAVAACFEQLSEEHAFILNAVHTERLSLAFLGQRLGISKTHAHRLLGEAQDALQQLLEQDTTIMEKIHGTNDVE